MKKAITFLIIIFSSINLAAQDKSENFLVFLNINFDREYLPAEKESDYVNGHLDALDKLKKEGFLKISGPFDAGGGFLILSAKNKKEAENLVNSDPAVAAKRYLMEVVPWNPEIGGVCKPENPDSLVSYRFMRFTVDNPDSLDAEFKFAKITLAVDDTIISAGKIPESHGFVFILKNTEKDLLKIIKQFDNCTVKGDRVEVPRGSFCEK